MDNSEQILRFMKNAEASINMEDLYVSDESRELCFKLLNKEITFDEYMSAIKARVAEQ